MHGSRNLSSVLSSLLAVFGAAIVAGCGGGSGGGSGDTIKTAFYAPLASIDGMGVQTLIRLEAAQVDALIRRAAEAVDAPNMTVAVVDRVGRPLGLWTRNPATSAVDLNIALSLARTGAFMSSSQGPITTRTLEYISTFHFPPLFGGLTRNPIPTSPFTLDPSLASQRQTVDVAGTPQGPLWLIFSCNRGGILAGQDLADVGLAQFTVFSPPTNGFNDMRIPPPQPVDINGNLLPGQPGNGLSYLAGGIPAYKAGDATQLPPNVPIFGVDGLASDAFPDAASFLLRVVGSIGVYITDANGVPQPNLAEFAAIEALRANGLFLDFNIVQPEGAIFLVGQLLPYVLQTSRPAGSNPGVFADDGVNGRTVIAPVAGGQQPFGWIIGPVADPLGNLTQADVEQIINQGIAAADQTRAAIRLPLGTPTKMWLSVTNLDGTILGVFRMEDAPIFSYDVSVTKARCVTYLSSFPGGNPDMHPADAAVLNAAGIPTGIPGTAGEFGVAITTRTLAFGTQPFFPPGIDTSPTGPGPLFPFAEQNADPAQFNRLANAAFVPGRQSGIIFFPGATPLYKNGVLVGGFGVSGDGVEQDDFVTSFGSAGFEAPLAKRVDNFFFQGVRWPYYKFPQLPGPGGN